MKIGNWLIYFSYLRECFVDRLLHLSASAPGSVDPARRRGSGQVQGVGDYDAWYYNRPIARAYFNYPRRATNLVDMIERFAPTRVLEFGSGLGHVLREARRRGILMVGTETSDYAVSHSLCPGAIVKIGEIPKCNLPFPNEAFDLVFSTEVMEHVPEACTLPVLRELHRICSHRALMTINTFDRDEPGHINVHPRQWWLKAFVEVGFEHNDRLWAAIDRMKYLDWEIFVLDKQAPSTR